MTNIFSLLQQGSLPLHIHFLPLTFSIATSSHHFSTQPPLTGLIESLIFSRWSPVSIICLSTSSSSSCEDLRLISQLTDGCPPPSSSVPSPAPPTWSQSSSPAPPAPPGPPGPPAPAATSSPPVPFSAGTASDAPGTFERMTSGENWTFLGHHLCPLITLMCSFNPIWPRAGHIVCICAITRMSTSKNMTFLSYEIGKGQYKGGPLRAGSNAFLTKKSFKSETLLEGSGHPNFYESFWIW